MKRKSMLKDAIKRIYASFLLFILAFDVIADENLERLTIIALDDFHPYSFRLPNGEVTGLYVDFWMLWSEINGRDIEIKLESFEQGLSLVKNSEVIHMGLFKTAERQKWLAFSQPFLNVKTSILYSRNYINQEKLAFDRNIKIGVLRSSFQAEFIKKNYPDHQLELFSNHEDALPKLLENKIDAIVGEIPRLKTLLDKHNLNGVLEISDEILHIDKVHAAVSVSNQKSLNMINQGIRNIPIDSIIQLEKKWIPEQLSFYDNNRFTSLLTQNELQWLHENKLIKLGTLPAAYPLGFLDDKGNFRGLVGEYVNHVKKGLDLEFEFIPHNSWSTLFSEFKTGQVDMLPAIVNTAERMESVNFTIPYFTNPNVVITRNDAVFGQSLKSLEHKTVGITDGYLRELLKKDYPSIQIQIINSIQEGLEKVSDGKLDAVIDAIAVINYELAKLQYHNLVITSLTPYKFELSFAVREGMEPLVPILNKIIDNINLEENSRYANTWLPSYIKTGIDKNTLMYWGVPIVIAIMIGIIFLTTTTNRRLNKLLNKNKTLARRIVAIQEEERRVLSRDLHDEIGQNLSALQLHINVAKNAKDMETLSSVIKSIDNITSLTYSSAYELMHWLRPRVLDDYGLEHALSNQIIINLLNDSNIKYHKNFVGNMAVLNEELSSNMYRIAQECITNACKHSNAKDLYVSAELTVTKLLFEIRDNGEGFNINEVMSQKKSFGLDSIQDRVDALGGSFQLSSNSKGTTYKFEFMI